MRHELMLFAVAVVVGLSTCSASPIMWQLQSAVFDDFGSATGSFVFDPDSTCPPCGPLSPNWDISTFGGNTSVFFPFEFTPTNSQAYWGIFNGDESFVFLSNQSFPTNFPPPFQNEQLSLRIVLTSFLTNASYSVPMDLNNPIQGECFSCSPYRVFISGSVIAAPEPKSVFLLLSALGCAGFFRASMRSPRSKRCKLSKVGL